MITQTVLVGQNVFVVKGFNVVPTTVRKVVTVTTSTEESTETTTTVWAEGFQRPVTAHLTKEDAFDAMLARAIKPLEVTEVVEELEASTDESTDGELLDWRETQDGQ